MRNCISAYSLDSFWFWIALRTLDQLWHEFSLKKRRKKLISSRYESGNILFLFPLGKWSYKTNAYRGVYANMGNHIWFTLGWLIRRVIYVAIEQVWRLLCLNEVNIIKHLKVLIIPEALVRICCGWYKYKVGSTVLPKNCCHICLCDFVSMLQKLTKHLNWFWVIASVCNCRSVYVIKSPSIYQLKEKKMWSFSFLFLTWIVFTSDFPSPPTSIL